MLTLQKLKDMKPGELIGTGTGTYPRVVGCEIKWAAVRGKGYHDWAIYCLTPDRSIEDIKKVGDKIFTESVIKRLIPCDDEAWKMYRF